MILDDLTRHVDARADEPAIVEVSADGGTRELTWRELASEVDRLAALLVSYGVAPGESVAFQLPNRLEFVTVALATLRVGAVCEPLMPIFRERELQFMLRESGARVLIVPERFRGHDYAAMADALKEPLPALEHVVIVPVDAPQASPPVRRPQPHDIAQLLFTSGSTGEPKGVLQRHEVLDGAADAHIAHFGLSSEDVIYVPSPLAHQTGFLYGMWIALRLGAAQVIQEVWDARAGLDAMRRFGVTFVQAATPFLADLTALAEESGRAARGPAHVRRHGRRDSARACPLRARDARRRGRWRMGHDRELPRHRLQTRRSARARVANRRAGARGRNAARGR